MTNWRDMTTIEISTPDGQTTGPIPAKQFSERVKGGLRTMAKSEKRMSKIGGRIENPEDSDSKPEYWADSELEEIATELIRKHHNHLLEAEISYRITSKPMSRAGKAIAGKAKKASGLLKHYARVDFIIVVADWAWDGESREKHMALVDHELCHCSVEHDKAGNRSWILVGHDVEEFTKIIDRHGLWHEGLKPFGQAVVRQLELPLAEGKAQSAKRHEEEAKAPSA